MYRSARAQRARALVLALTVALAPGPLLAQEPAPEPAQELTIPQVVRQAGPAVVFLRAYDAAGRQTTMGSGFIAADGRIVTNLHVVQGAERVEVYDPEGAELGTTSFAEALSTAADLAVLPALGSPSATLELAGETPEVGEAVVVIGSPEGFANTVSDGIVSAYRSVEGQRLMQISAPISQGSSGGPVLNRRGEVIGVTAAVWAGGQNLNFAVPLTDLRAVLDEPAERVAFPAVRLPAGGGEPASGAAPRSRLRRG